MNSRVVNNICIAHIAPNFTEQLCTLTYNIQQHFNIYLHIFENLNIKCLAVYKMILSLLL